jgi:hypothetical protein
VTIPIVDPPRVRPAGSLGLLEEDVQELRGFGCLDGTGAWYERDAARILRKAAAALEARKLADRDRVLLFERDGILHAVSVFTESSDVTAELVFLGLAAEFHGARIDSASGDRLSDAVLSATLDAALDLGFERVTAHVARPHARSRAMLDRAGFQVLSQADRDYDLCVVSTSIA